MHGDNAHALVYSPKSGESPFSFSRIFSIYVHQLIALYCVVPEGFHISLKPEEALIYLYDGYVVRIYLGSVQAMGSVCMVPQTATCEDNPVIGPS